MDFSRIFRIFAALKFGCQECPFLSESATADSFVKGGFWGGGTAVRMIYNGVTEGWGRVKTKGGRGGLVGCVLKAWL